MPSFDSGAPAFRHWCGLTPVAQRHAIACEGQESKVGAALEHHAMGRPGDTNQAAPSSPAIP